MNKSSPARDELQRSLARLHAELAATPSVNEVSRRLLRDVLVDIERLLGVFPDAAATRTVTAATPGSTSGGDALPIATAPRRLETVAVEFEARHPTLAASLRQLIDLLSQAGL